MSTDTEAVTANAFYALVDEEMAKTKCTLQEGVRRIRASNPKLSAAVWVDTAKPVAKFEAEMKHFDVLIEAEMAKTGCDARTALDRVKRRETELARKAFGGEQ